MSADLLDNHGDLFAPLNPIEAQSLRGVTDKLFTFLTNRSIHHPEEIAFYTNKGGYREARYIIPNLNIGHHLIFPELVITQQPGFTGGNSLIRAAVEVGSMDFDDYLVGSINNTRRQQFSPFTSSWIEGSEGFHPISMSMEFYVNNHHYKLNIGRHGQFVEVSTDNPDLSIYLNNTFYKNRRRNQADPVSFFTQLSQILSANGVHSSYEQVTRNLIDIPLTQYFAMRDFGYNVTQNGDVIPLLIYR